MGPPAPAPRPKPARTVYMRLDARDAQLLANLVAYQQITDPARPADATNLIRHLIREAALRAGQPEDALEAISPA